MARKFEIQDEPEIKTYPLKVIVPVVLIAAGLSWAALYFGGYQLIDKLIIDLDGE